MDNFWGLDIKFQHLEEVIIDSAEVKGVVECIQFDTLNGYIEYAVKFPYGAVMVENGDPGLGGWAGDCGKYNTDIAWFTEDQLRKIKG